jgi:Protein of unknown function (DUF3768)
MTASHEETHVETRAPETTPTQTTPIETPPSETCPSQHTSTNPTNTKIRLLNDRLRKTGNGGKVLLTDGILSLGLDTSRRVLDAVSAFDTFTKDNDTWHEHDCATQSVDGHSIIWKIDYYDRQMMFHSPDPSDCKKTIRVLTIMLASEY